MSKRISHDAIKPWHLFGSYVFGAVTVSLLIWQFSKWQANQTSPATIQTQIDREFQIQKQLFGFVDVFGKLAFGLTAYLAWSNFELSRQQKVIAENKQLADRFSKAVEMLGFHNNCELQIGGIYALERIALDHKNDYYWTVIEVLTAFIRSNSPLISDVAVQPKAKPEIQTAFSIVFKLLPWRTEDQNKMDVNLTKTNLKGVVLVGKGNLNRVFFNDSCLDEIVLNSIEMKGAYCRNATFYNANMAGGHFERTYFENASFKDTDMDSAYFEGAQFVKADFTGASVYEADFRKAYGIKAKRLKEEAKNGDTAIFEGSSRTASVTVTGS